MSGGQFLGRITASALLIASLRTAQPQSTNLPKPEKKSAVPDSLAAKNQPVKLSGAFYLERSGDSFGIRSHGIIEQTTSGSKLYPLPQSDFETYKKLHAADLKYILPYVLSAKDYVGLEVIGPQEVEGSRI